MVSWASAASLVALVVALGAESPRRELDIVVAEGDVDVDMAVVALQAETALEQRHAFARPVGLASRYSS